MAHRTKAKTRAVGGGVTNSGWDGRRWASLRSRKVTGESATSRRRLYGDGDGHQWRDGVVAAALSHRGGWPTTVQWNGRRCSSGD